MVAVMRSLPVFRAWGAVMLRVMALLAVLVIGAGIPAADLLKHTDRQQIAYYAELTRLRDDYLSAVYLYDVGRGLQVPVLPTMFRVNGLVWSPDGDSLALTIQQGQNLPYHLYVVNADGRGLRRLTDQPAGGRRMSWSPDGRQIVFSSDASHTPLYVVDVDSGTLYILGGSMGEITSSLVWSPDGEWAVFTGLLPGDEFQQLYLINSGCVQAVETCRPVRLADNPNAHNWMPAWSPDDTQIVFISQQGDVSYLYVVDVLCADSASCGHAARRLTEQHVTSSTPLWSPDGRWLVFGISPGGFGSRLYLRDMSCADCDTLLRITPDGFSDISPAWSPDGRWLAYVTYNSAASDRKLDIALLDIRCAAAANCLGAGRHLTHGNWHSWSPVWRP